MKIIKYILISGLALILISSCVKSCVRSMEPKISEFFYKTSSEYPVLEANKRERDSLKRLEEKSKDLKVPSEYDK